MNARLSCLLASVVLLAGGCQKLTFEKDITLTPVTMPIYDFDPPSYQQKVTVTITSKSGGVSAYLFKASDLKAVEKALNSDKEPDSSLLLGGRAGKSDPESYSFEATVPAKTPYQLLLKAPGKTTDVKIKVVGR